MAFYHLSAAQTNELLALPETGMGFQIVDATFWGDPKTFFVLNATKSVDLTGLGIGPSSDPTVLERNEQRIIEELRREATTMFAAPGPQNFRLKSSRVIPMGAASVAPVAARPSSLVKTVTISQSRLFHRFSAFSPDKRVDPVTGDFSAGTFAAPESEVPFVPTGFVAVGRFALPNTLPASHHYVLRAPTGTIVSFGTVAPAFGQAGGGVEAFFKTAVINQLPRLPPSTIPDE